jgi:hypothetical protein
LIAVAVIAYGLTVKTFTGMDSAMKKKQRCVAQIVVLNGKGIPR